MIRYSVQPRGQIFVNSYGFLSFAKIMGKDIATDVLASGTHYNSHRSINRLREWQYGSSIWKLHSIY